MADQMRWASALSTRASLEAAVKEVAERAQTALGVKPDLGMVFISSAFSSEFVRLMPLLQEHLSVPVLIGCGGGGVVGMDNRGGPQEIEQQPALSLSLAYLPDVNIQAFHIDADYLPDLDSPPHRWEELIGTPAGDRPQFILLADPFGSGINDLLQGLDFAYPGCTKVGGLANLAPTGQSSGLFCNFQSYRQGTVGVALSGNIQLDAIVAQGCRPIGQPYRVVESERHILLKIEEPVAVGGGKSAAPRTPLEVLKELFQTLDDDDRLLAQHSLFVGIAQSEFKQALEPGDFLIRNLIGVDPHNGAIAVGDRIRPGQRIQFHLRDAKASAEDLRTMLQRYLIQQGESSSPVGALMFSCVGRGEGLYNEPNFDSELFSYYLNDIPLGGFFCNGEIGPVGGSTFLHGYTSVFGICRQP